MLRRRLLLLLGAPPEVSAPARPAPSSWLASPAHPTEAVVLPAAPELTWFVATFDDVCDRFGFTSKGQSFIVGVPPGYPHRNDCAS